MSMPPPLPPTPASGPPPGPGWNPQPTGGPVQPAPGGATPGSRWTPQPAPGGPLPAGQAAPPRRRSRLWLIVGVVVIVIVAAVAFQGWQTEQTYQAGHAAYLSGDCAAAVEQLSTIADGDDDTALKAQAEVEECETLAEAQALRSTDPAGATLATSEFLAKYPDGPLSTAAMAEVKAIVADTPPDDLATVDLCLQLEGLEAQGIVASGEPALPPLLIACGAAHESDQRYTDALVVLDRFLAEYPDHELAATAEAAFARVSIADAELSGAGSLPAPTSVGESEAGDGLMKVVIQNDSPQSMVLVFNGPDVRVERLEPCADCEEYVGVGPEDCPEQGPVGEYVMEPGVYDVVVKASDDVSVTPFRGQWSLEPGDEYYSCFYLVTTPGS